MSWVGKFYSFELNSGGYHSALILVYDASSVRLAFLKMFLTFWKRDK